jgi:NADPH:quinone reductase-like Zn-dependent oxidoreductase
MRAVVITKRGGPEVLQVQERPEPVIGAGKVLVDVRAAGVNFADTMVRVGMYPDAPKLPAVVGYEVAGTIAEIADGVEGLAVGDRVMAGTRFGGYAERVVATASDVVPLPERLSFEQGAAIPVNYSTAWAGLIRYGSLEAGERVLIHAAAGGVGIAATQIAKRHGGEVYGTASASKHDAIRAQGVDVALDYRQDGWERGLPKLLAPGGRLVAFGASSLISGEKRNPIAAVRGVLRMPRFNLIKQMGSSKAVIGLNMLTLWDSAGTLEPWIRALGDLMEDGTIEPVIAEAVPFDGAPEAHRILGERRNVGKVVLVP